MFGRNSRNTNKSRNASSSRETSNSKPSITKRPPATARMNATVWMHDAAVLPASINSKDDSNIMNAHNSRN